MPSRCSAAGAAFINGTAAHGEDFDDTFEGGPVHAGAVIVPAVLAAAEQEGLMAPPSLRGIAVGVETICRLSLVVPKAVHKAGFHPTAVFGAMARPRASAPPCNSTQGSSSTRWASPARWPAASSSTWPTAAGPSACIRAGRRSRACARRCSARAGFTGPRTVFEGVHGLFHGFAHTREGN